MADQSVRACHPSKFYYFRRSLLISCCYILSPPVLRPPLPSSRIPITLLSPFTPFSLSFSRSACPVFFHLFSSPCYSSSLYSLAGSIFDSRRDTRKRWGRKKERERRREMEGEKERKRAPPACYIGERNKTATRNLEHVCSGFAAAASSRRFTL